MSCAQHKLPPPLTPPAESPMSSSSASGAAAAASSDSDAWTSVSSTHINSDFHQAGLHMYIQDALAMLLENRPVDPILFLAHYFRHASNGAPALARAYRYIRLAPYHRPNFLDNVVSAFCVLDSDRSGSSSSSSHPSAGGVTMRETSRLLHLLTASLPVDIAPWVVASLQLAPNDLVSFEQFASSVHCVLAVEECVDLLRWVFQAAPKVSTDPALIDRESFLYIISQLRESYDEGGMYPSDEQLLRAIRMAGMQDAANAHAATLNFKQFADILVRCIFNVPAPRAMATRSVASLDPSEILQSALTRQG